MNNVFDLLEERGLIAQATDAAAIKELLSKEKVEFYIGFDATADSLHAGHFLQMIVMRHMQRAGHTPIALMGGGTTMVGDPTGKTDMRKMLSREDINHNADCFRKQMKTFIDFEEDKAILVDNADWLLHLNYIDFLRDVGVHFSVNRMLSAECFKSRLEKGLSFIEFNYMIMQSYDFLMLHDNLNCKMQLGGNDQWANIIGGVELVRRMRKKDVYGLTFTLLTTKEGKKMGKTENGTIWLDPNKTSPFEFFQYWRNIDDADLQNCLRLLTDEPLCDIDSIDMTSGTSINAAKEKLAFILTMEVHGLENATKSKETAASLFSGAKDSDNIPFVKITLDMLKNDEIGILELCVAAGLASSNGEARRLAIQGGISVDSVKVADFKSTISKEALLEGVLLQKGKKQFVRVSL